MDIDQLQDLAISSLTLLGFLLVLKRAIALLNWTWAMFLRPPKNLKDYGSWAVITGPTDGIGKALAFEMASKDLNLVLVGRSPSKLRATTDEIIVRSPHVEIRTIVLDLAKSRGEEIMGAIRDGTEGLDVGVVVNNAGVGFPVPMLFHEMESELLESSLRVNVEAATWVLKATVPAMLRKGRGAVVNIGSGSSVVVPSYPLQTVYGATKAYVAMLSRCMSLEYKQHGLDIQCQIPLLVSTKMTRLRRSRFVVASAEEYARASLRGIGYEQLCCPLWTQSLQWAILASLPDALLNRLTFRYYLQVRERILAKAQARSQEAKVGGPGS